MEADLIPGLPADIALECLLRLPFHALAGARCVCKRWRQKITSPSFYGLRKAGGHARPLIALIQWNPSGGPGYKNLNLFEPTAGVWTRLPAVPDCSSYCQVAAVGHELVVIDGGRPPTGTVHVYNLLTGVRRRGATIPGPRRTAFAFAASAEARMAYVAGGKNEHGESLRSALAYDVAADAWVRLPDMALSRKECRGIFVNGAFCVAGGQEMYHWTSEVFDVAAGRWTAKHGMLLEESLINPFMGAAAAAESRLYRCGGKVEVDVCSGNSGEGVGGWRRLRVVPEKLNWLPAQVAAENGGVMVLGTSLARRIPCILEEGKWRQVVIPTEFAGLVRSLCGFQL
ncbi:F-box/kelch-repeat protein At1g80440-like [Zingiber officinale]|uniref:F-box domain-containing protein n=1 Tax=Zingiber officinale TaxID=94328 RepID=A0A8J5KPK8_ZINOF|nr:F-box/kelch-repeat protein At1g80440-like [Zingiber officinale]KAG6486259.1 hypothetical protein ZIOFF_054829 [Zingiber officinale]